MFLFSKSGLLKSAAPFIAAAFVCLPALGQAQPQPGQAQPGQPGQPETGEPARHDGPDIRRPGTTPKRGTRLMFPGPTCLFLVSGQWLLHLSDPRRSPNDRIVCMRRDAGTPNTPHRKCS